MKSDDRCGVWTIAVAATVILATAGSVAGADVLTQAEAAARAARVGTVAYALSLRLAEGSGGFDGKTTVDFTLADSAGDLRVDFQWTRIDAITLNGSPLPIPGAADKERCQIALPHAGLCPGANRLEVTYRNDFDRSGDGFHRVIDPEDGREYCFTNFEPFYAHRMLPCFDQPDLKAPLTLDVTAPRTWRVIANSPEVMPRETPFRARTPMPGGPGGTDAVVRRYFGVTPAISTYLYFVAAGPFITWVDPTAPVPARIFARASLARYTPSRELQDITRRGLEFYPRFFGVPFPFSKYDQIFVPEMDGDAMENPGAVAIHDHNLYRSTPTLLERQDRASTMLHEMSHMWFGDLVTMRWWDGLWLNESFATYMEAFALSRATEFKDAFEEFNATKAGAYREDQLPTTHPVAGTIADTDAAVTSFDGITYNKGAALLKQLAYYIGEDAFRRGVTDYFRTNAWGSTRTADFFRSESRAAGKDLTRWCKLHFEAAGVNTLRVRLELARGAIRRLYLDQASGNAGAPLRPQKLAVALYGAGPGGAPVLQRSVAVTIAGESTRVRALEGAPAPVLVWPNHDDQAYARVVLDDTSLATVRAHIDAIEDGLTRRGLWLSLWDMTRDGLLPAADFASTALEKAPRERDPKLLATILGNVLYAAHHFTADDGAALLPRVHALASAQLASAAPGSDAQKEWFRVLGDSATGQADLAELADLLDGRLTIPGLPLDQPRRWGLIDQLAGRGAPGAAARIASERSRDASDLGERMALTCRAALPDRAVKEEIFHRIVTDPTSSMELLGAAMAGFHPHGQSDLARLYVDRYFEGILALRGHREPEMVATFATAMFPDTVHDRSVVDKARRFLEAHPDLTEDLRKPILNAADELARCLRVRALPVPPRRPLQEEE